MPKFIEITTSNNVVKMLNISCIQSVSRWTRYKDELGTVIVLTSQAEIYVSEPYKEIVAKLSPQALTLDETNLSALNDLRDQLILGNVAAIKDDLLSEQKYLSALDILLNK